MVAIPFALGAIPVINFTMTAGSYMLIKVTVKDDTGAVFNITGMTLKWGLYNIVTGVEVLTKITPTQIALIDAVNGRADVILENVDTASLLGRHYHELHVIDVVPTPDRPKRVMKGEILIEASRVAVP